MRITGAVLEEIGRDKPYRDSAPIVVQELELAAPGLGEILVRIEAAGLCHSDLSVVDGNRVRPIPMLLGHESCGIVEELGEGVTDLEAGDRVVMSFLPRCEECANCAEDGRLPCTTGTATNNAGTLLGDRRLLSRQHDGERQEVYHHLGVSGFATHAVVNQASAVKVDHDVPPDLAAVLGCAVLTGGGAVINAAQPKAGDSLMIVGLGGVGMAALLTALSLDDVEVIAVDALEEKLDLAREWGVERVYTPAQVVEEGIKATHAVECAGHAKAFETAFLGTAVGGRTVTVGLPAPSARSEVSPLTITAEARTVIGSYLGSAVPARDIPRYAQMWREGRLPVEKLISSRIRLDEINAAMDQLADGKAIRQVILFDQEGDKQ